mgnify:CR=1 FL=1
MNKEISLRKILPVMFGFFIMGFVDIVGVSTSYVKNDFAGMNDTMVNLISLSCFLWFFLLSIPTGMLMNRIGRKKTILFGCALLAAMFLTFYFLTTLYSTIHPVMFVCFALVGFAWAAINVNSLPMVLEMCRGSDIGKFTGYYYTFSMAAQVVTPVLAGTLMRHISYRVLFPYAALFVGASFVTMCFVRHGDSRAEGKSGLAAFEDMDD